MRIRLRPVHSDDYLAVLYAKPHNHLWWQDHRQRVRSTIALAQWFEDVKSVADLSAGDAAIVSALDVPVKYIGDFAPKYEFTGSLDETIEQIPNVDLFILSETIEHVNDPDSILSKIRAKTKHLILTTPNGESDDGNPEHYWGWDDKDMRQMLVGAGFKPEIYSLLHFENPNLIYDYQMWGCS